MFNEIVLNGTFILTDPWLFFKTHGTDSIGWVFMSFFFTISLAMLVGYIFFRIVRPDKMFYFILTPYLMGCCYMLIAEKQFYILRSDNVHVNLILASMNAVTWYFTVIETGIAAHQITAAQKKLAIRTLSIAGLGLLFLGSLCGNAVRYGCFVTGYLPICVALYLLIYKDATHTVSFATERRLFVWLLITMVFILFQTFIMMIGHQYQDLLRLSASLAASATLNVVGYFFQIYSHNKLEFHSAAAPSTIIDASGDISDKSDAV